VWARHLAGVVRRPAWDVLAAVAVGGMAGASARYGIQRAWPTEPGGFPWATFAINISGCALIGILMVIVVEIGFGHRLVRPLLGTGVLGGYTTFSTYAVDVQQLVAGGAPLVAIGYLVLTPTAALASVWAGTVLARRMVRK
jgi:fluoride exporter